MALALVAFLQDAGESTSLEIPTAMAWGIPIACIVAAICLALTIGRHGDRRRALQRLAASEHLVYSDADPANLAALRFPTFASARGVVIRDVLTLRTAAGDVRAFDFALWDEYESRTNERDAMQGVADEIFGFDPRPAAETKRSYSRVRSGAIVRVNAFLPPCIIRPVSWVTRTFEAIGVADLDFESDEFNNGWDVRCSDGRFASLFVDAQLIDLIVSLDRKVALETFGNYVLLTANLCRPARQLQLLHAAARIPQQLSPLVVEEYPTALAMEARTSVDAWQQRPNGRGGVY